MARERPRHGGQSLIEVLVATALLAAIVVIALTVYDASRRACVEGADAVAMHQSVRVAFDTLTSELQRLGENVNPDGNAARPDEALEVSLDHAVVFRGDFDRADPTASAIPESALQGGAFSSVSTGNDEIVGYVLAKPDASGPDAIVFEADVGQTPRDGAVERVTIDNVVLTPAAPPYTLYRITLNNDAGTYGSAAFVVRTPVIEDVRDLSFTYYGDAGTFHDPSASVSETAQAKALRRGLRRIGVAVSGMSRQSDPERRSSAARASKIFELRGDVTPRNVGLEGLADLYIDLGPSVGAFSGGDVLGPR